MEIEVLKVCTKSDLELVEYHLNSIDGVTSQSFQNNSMRSKPTWYYLFSYQKSIIGVIELYDEVNPTELFITNLGVVEQQQGLGVGRQIIKWLDNHAAQAGYKTIRLTATPTSYGFYEKSGFSKIANTEFGYRKAI
ncbi:GNAT family N-acetyltransferase [Vibrio parahaemolyticus]|uniref:GNAT family N-acetyltransferase n=1 Tax=Vibrio parahaemolyticus TaxID=670 RepID=UPI001E599908|nr:GNAT family N-acetyltransferase [Vibrio parahaemolyticus]ELB2135085.1 GNAT family N-acetyltransferase [Vibrio parahaemolyticus]MCQ9048950.1 GNAT family N-acetyltransferase [Vibrio parahaemolyticus]